MRNLQNTVLQSCIYIMEIYSPEIVNTFYTQV